MSKESSSGATSAGKTTSVPVTPVRTTVEHKPDTIQQPETVSRPLGGLYAGPSPAQAAHDAGQSSGPQITSTASMQGHPAAGQAPRPAAPREVSSVDARKKEIDAQKKGAEIVAKHNEALAKAKVEVAHRTPEGKTGHSISPTVRQDEEMIAAQAMGAPKVDIATGEKDRPMRYDPEAPISHSILPTVREDEELGIIPKDRAITKEEAEKKTDHDGWVGSNERQQHGAPGGIVGEQSASSKPVTFEKAMGPYDGRMTVTFESGMGPSGNDQFKHSFGFELPNIVGALGMSQMNKESIILIIEDALTKKLGLGGVLRK